MFAIHWEWQSWDPKRGAASRCHVHVQSGIARAFCKEAQKKWWKSVQLFGPRRANCESETWHVERWQRWPNLNLDQLDPFPACVLHIVATDLVRHSHLGSQSAAMLRCRNVTNVTNVTAKKEPFRCIQKTVQIMAVRPSDWVYPYGFACKHLLAPKHATITRFSRISIPMDDGNDGLHFKTCLVHEIAHRCSTSCAF